VLLKVVNDQRRAVELDRDEAFDEGMQKISQIWRDPHTKSVTIPARELAILAGRSPASVRGAQRQLTLAVRADDEKGSEDLCADIRSGRFTAHRAQVAVVMAARELGIPSYGFASSSGGKIHLVGTWVDGMGWILMDVERPGEGWFTGGPPLLTMAPLLGGFSASAHDFWTPEGGAYADSQWGQGTSSISGTVWRARAPIVPVTDTTEARATGLAEACR